VSRRRAKKTTKAAIPASTRVRRVRVCANCHKPILQPLTGPRAGIWLHTDGEEGCRDAWGYPWAGAVATPRPAPRLA